MASRSSPPVEDNYDCSIADSTHLPLYLRHQSKATTPSYFRRLTSSSIMLVAVTVLFSLFNFFGMTGVSTSSPLAQIRGAADVAIGSAASSLPSAGLAVTASTNSRSTASLSTGAPAFTHASPPAGGDVAPSISTSTRRSTVPMPDLDDHLLRNTKENEHRFNRALEVLFTVPTAASVPKTAVPTAVATVVPAAALIPPLLSSANPFYRCPPFSGDTTSFPTYNNSECRFTVCPGDTLTASACDGTTSAGGYGDTTFYLVDNASGEFFLSSDDNSCGLLSIFSYTAPPTTGGSCHTFSLLQQCTNDYSVCGTTGGTEITVTSPPTAAPTAAVPTTAPITTALRRSLTAAMDIPYINWGDMSLNTTASATTISGACAFLVLFFLVGAGGGLFYYCNKQSPCTVIDNIKAEATNSAITAKKESGLDHVDDEIGVAPGQLSTDDDDDTDHGYDGYRYSYSESPRAILERAMMTTVTEEKVEKDTTDTAADTDSFGEGAGSSVFSD